MATVKDEYVVREVARSRRKSKKPIHIKWRDWWWVTAKQAGKKYVTGITIKIGSIHFPNKYIGKKIRIKIEIIQEK